MATIQSFNPIAAKKEELLQRINKAIQQNGYFKLSTCDHYNWDTHENLAMESLAQTHPSNLYFIRNVHFGVTDWNVVSI